MVIDILNRENVQVAVSVPNRFNAAVVQRETIQLGVNDKSMPGDFYRAAGLAADPEVAVAVLVHGQYAYPDQSVGGRIAAKRRTAGVVVGWNNFN